MSKPWACSSASVIRSRPKPRHAVWAGAPSCEVDPVGAREVVLVVVERGDRGRLRPGDRHEDLELQLPARAGCAASIRPLRPKNGSVATSSLPRRPSAREQLERALAPAVPPLVRPLRLADAARSRAGGTSAAEPDRPRARGGRRRSRRRRRVDAARRRAARARRSPDRPGSRRRASARGRSCAGTRSSPRAGWPRSSCSAACASLPSKEKIAAGEVRERLQVADRARGRGAGSPAESAAARAARRPRRA